MIWMDLSRNEMVCVGVFSGGGDGGGGCGCGDENLSGHRQDFHETWNMYV